MTLHCRFNGSRLPLGHRDPLNLHCNLARLNHKEINFEIVLEITTCNLFDIEISLSWYWIVRDCIGDSIESLECDRVGDLRCNVCDANERIFLNR